MIFNSISFIVFFTAFFFIYWFGFGKNFKHQNLFLLIGSYVFYGWADWHFLFFLIGVSTLNFILGIYIEKSENLKLKKALLYIGLIQGIGGLAYFKYYNFFIDSFKNLFDTLHLNFSLHTLTIVIPLGISFFTFRTISYVLDIENGKMKATKDWIAFFTYVAFFPSLLSGPIDKARNFIPQLEQPRVFLTTQASDAMRQILWGLFKKIVVANNCAIITNEVFKNYETLPASSLLIGSFLFAIEIYADFSGYSDMAIGVSKLLGFTVNKNFDFPYFSQNIAEYWRKWHISLTSWLTEYVFTPLSIAFRDYGNAGLILAIMINFIIVGIWHGANWTFVLYGFIHGLYFIPIILKGNMNKKKKIAKGKSLPSLKETINVLLTFSIVMLTMVIFKTETITAAFHYYTRLFSLSLFTKPIIDLSVAVIAFSSLFIMIIVEWLNREKEHGFSLDTVKISYIRWSFYFFLLTFILFFGVFVNNQFIYFKF